MVHDGELAEPVIVAIVGGVMAQLPPVVALARMVVLCTHSPVLPVIGVDGLMSRVRFTVQLPIAYVMAAVPMLIPSTLPVVPSILILLLVVLHAPPLVPFVSMMVAPWHTEEGPPIAVGAVLTVTVSFVEQPPVL
jgi:hypothetical protein